MTQTDTWDDMAQTPARQGLEHEIFMQFGKREDLSNFKGKIIRNTGVMELMSKPEDRGYVLAQDFIIFAKLRIDYSREGRSILMYSSEPKVAFGFYWEAKK